MALNKDLTDAEIKDIADKLTAELLRSEGCRKFDDCLRGSSGVGFSERVKERDVQETIEPNDPFYWDPASHKEKGKMPGVSGFSSAQETGLTGVCFFPEQVKSPVHDQWGLHAIGFTPRSNKNSAWNLVDADQKNTVVAVIDSGLDITHPDGPKYLWVNPKEIPDNGKDDDGNGYIDDVHGWNFLDNNNVLTDSKGHGTLIAGIIAARSNNDLAITGVNPGAQIMVLKVADEKGRADSVGIFRALRYATDNGARVINISLGGLGVSRLEGVAVDYAHAKGIVVVVAGGNQSANIEDYGPPALRNVISVGAADQAGQKMWFSNVGSNVGLLAPGKGILSLYSRDSEWTGPAQKKKDLVCTADGTSFAAPFVSAVASLLLAKDPQLKNTDIEDILYGTAKDMDIEGWDRYAGAGFLDAVAALSGINKKQLTVRFTGVIFRKDEKGRLLSVDLYGIVRGDLESYEVELTKGTKAGNKGETIFESRNPADEGGLICHIEGEKLQFGKEWSVRIIARDRAGRQKKATLQFSVGT